jgi:hypothetical protein
VQAQDGRRERYEKRVQEKGAEKHKDESYNIYGFAYALQVNYLRSHLRCN